MLFFTFFSKTPLFDNQSLKMAKKRRKTACKNANIYLHSLSLLLFSVVKMQNKRKKECFHFLIYCACFFPYSSLHITKKEESKKTKVFFIRGDKAISFSSFSFKHFMYVKANEEEKKHHFACFGLQKEEFRKETPLFNHYISGRCTSRYPYQRCGYGKHR